MHTVTTIGLDIAKSVFQVHGVDAAGQVVIRRQLKRRYVLAFFQKLQPCLIGIEACASSHYWSRELQALGHSVRLMPPTYVKPYVKRQKNDMADAEAICEAVTRANMRFGPGSAHGVRKIAATRAANAGATVAQLEAIFGWQGGSMAALYTRAADRRRLSIEAMSKLGNDKRTSIVAPLYEVRHLGEKEK